MERLTNLDKLKKSNSEDVATILNRKFNNYLAQELRGIGFSENFIKNNLKNDTDLWEIWLNAIEEQKE